MQRFRHLIAITIIISINGCSSYSVPLKQKAISQSTQNTLNLTENKGYKVQFEQWKGTPYKYGGSTKRGVDCSAFVQSIIQEVQNRQLPRTTSKQALSGYKVNFNEAKSGDLVFFKTTIKDTHVGVFLGDNKFMHASTSNGVIISRLDNPYWSSVFWQVRRLD